jgi:cellulose synthase/poly-beta-1,6-N-acetylglucosamine synthase-like glycosyltransferase
MNLISVILLCLVFIPSAYWFLLAIAAIKPRHQPGIMAFEPCNKFALVIPAHNEETVIEKTVQRLLTLDYPANLYTIHIVADLCSDATASLARRAGAIVYERSEGPRNGKASALSWLFQYILAEGNFDAVVIFDADTRVDKNFLRAMDLRLQSGDKIIQGQHIISNSDDGWFPALTWAMFLIDNRFQNLGRANLGWSAKNMGDSICLRADVLRQVGWGEGLADDYQMRQKFLLHGVKIAYEPAAKGFGEAPLTWAQARAQRLRWIRGVDDANQQYASQLLRAGISTRDPALLDAALQAHLPSYSFLAVGTVFLFLIDLLAYRWLDQVMPPLFLALWLTLLSTLFLYPIFGLALEKAPKKAYRIILLSPVFIIWRIWLTIVGRLAKQNVTWIRTAHKG